MRYYIIFNGQQVGPMPKEELVKYGLNPSSKVWGEGMPNWVDASTVAELQPLLYPQQPPMPPTSQTPPPPQPQQPYYGGYQAPYNNQNTISLGDAIKNCFQKYAEFSGRARRSEYWYFALFNFIVGLLVGWIPFVGLFVSLGLLIPSIAVGVRRLHDTGRSGWLYLLALVPIAGTIVLIIWFCEDSQKDNEYGPSPKYPGR